MERTNGCTPARRVEVSSNSLDTSVPVCAVVIDYGTTHCSMTYIRSGSGEEIRASLDTSGQPRVPNSVLFNERGIIAAFGHEAVERYRKLPTPTRKKYRFFEHVKKTILSSVIEGQVRNYCSCCKYMYVY